MIVWCAAEEVYPGVKFTNYCLLGDDIMICDEAVALKYKQILDGLCVKISLEKSLISTNGEFCKQFYINKLTVNCSPISPKLLIRSHHPYSLLALHEKAGVTDLNILSRIQGARFKQRCKPVSERKEFQFIYLYLQKKNCVNLSFWLGGGVPLDPYSYGKIIDKLRTLLIPKEIIPFPPPWATYTKT